MLQKRVQLQIQTQLPERGAYFRSIDTIDLATRTPEQPIWSPSEPLYIAEHIKMTQSKPKELSVPSATPANGEEQ